MSAQRTLLLALFCATVAGISPTHAAQNGDTNTTSNYQSGRALCQTEKGGWLEVPRSYNLVLNSDSQRYELKASTQNPPTETTEIFYRIYSDGQNQGAFLRPGRPSILYFEGGPAGVAATRSEFFKAQSLELGVNIITFEIRGVSCSRPSTYEAYTDRKLYSAFYIAGDAKMLLDHLGVREVLVYGLSYGTFPARLFGYLYPKQVKSTLLEGTFSLNLNQRHEGAPVLESLKELYAKLFFNSPAPVLEAFSYLSSSPNFSKWMNAYLDNLSQTASYLGARGMRDYFSKLNSHRDNWEELASLMARHPVESPWRSSVGPAGEANIDMLVFEMYMCRDFDRTESLSARPVTIDAMARVMAEPRGGYDERWDDYFQGSCLRHKQAPDQGVQAILDYHGGMMPLETPVLMFNGGLDAMTPSVSAQVEAQQLDTPHLTFLEFTDEGHAPWNLTYLYGEPEKKSFVQTLVRGWVGNGNVEMGPEQLDFMQKNRIQHFRLQP